MTTDVRPLNKLEIWVAEHSAPIFLTILVLITIGVGATFWIWHKQGDTQAQVNVLKPQVTKVSRAICDSESLEHPDRAARCAERIRVGLVNCRHSVRCRAALLAIVNYPPPGHAGATTSPGLAGDTGGGGAQNPSHAGQQPGPVKGPPAPSPAAPQPAAPEHGPPADTPGNGPPASPGKSSGAGVEVCALSKCVGAEVDVDPKGLIP